MRQCMDAENLHRRLKKIIGQVQAIDRMVDEDIPVRMYWPRSMRQSQRCTEWGRWFWRDTSITVSVTVLNTEMPIRPSQILQRPWSGLPT